MFSLYQLLLTRHAGQFKTRRYSEEIVAQIRRRLEDAVIEDNPAALVVECLPFAAERPMRDVARVDKLGRSARYSFFFVSEDDALNGAPIYDDRPFPTAAVSLDNHDRSTGVLLVMSDDPRRVWQDNEVLLMRTVADQVAVAVGHARLFQHVQNQALTDGLTGCSNRRCFDIQLERELKLAVKLRCPVSLILLDIDHFKRVNDTHGHDAGDAALSVLGWALREDVRGVDTAARYGGEEFAVILPQADPAGALVIAERLRLKVEHLAVPGVGRITISLGVATFPRDGDSPALLIKAADSALYRAKKSGRNRVCVAES